MEFLGRVVVETANSHKLPYELEHSIAKHKIVCENTCVGLSRNNFLIEFNLVHFLVQNKLYGPPKTFWSQQFVGAVYLWIAPCKHVYRSTYTMYVNG